MGDLSKPQIDSASGITPTISIEQKSAGTNPRSTVATLTEIYDYLRLLYARVGTPHCPVSGEPVGAQSREEILLAIQNANKNESLILLAPYATGKKGEFREDFEYLLKRGYMRVRVDGEIHRIEEIPALDGNVSHNVDVVIDRIANTKENKNRLAESVIHALEFGNGICKVLVHNTQNETLYSQHAYSQTSGISYPPLDPHDFSFNSPKGMCKKCHGLGTTFEFDLDQVIDQDLSISGDCCSIAGSYETVRWGNIYQNLAKQFDFSVKTPWKKLSEEAKDLFLHGTKEDKWLRMQFVNPNTGSKWSDWVKWRGVIYEAHKRYSAATSESYRKRMEELMRHMTCPSCSGTRLKPYPAATKLGKKTITNVVAMTISEGLEFFLKLKVTKSKESIATPLLEEIQRRLRFLEEVGLHYLSLERTAPTLSGGEAQRVRLASQIGSGLVGITYVLDEPSIGLHPRDNEKLIQTLHLLRDHGNTVIVVEHDEETIFQADSVIDFGPGPGKLGGIIVHQGSVKTLLDNPESLTGAYLKGALEIPIPKKRRKAGKKSLAIQKASHNNLKGIDVTIPLGLLITVTGVSGSGKSSLILDTLYPALSNALHHGQHKVGAHKTIKGLKEIDKVIAIDQSPIGRNPRSNPSTYIKVFDEIRELFAKLPGSKTKGWKAGRFSFNVADGSCTGCSGMGMVKVDMDFLEDAWVTCDQCHGRRFDEETLSIKYKEKNIYDVLELSVSEAHRFFKALPSISHKLSVLEQVGMGYIKLGQSSTTLSGGEAQRIKLARHLVRPESGNTIYLFDEPTTGLHFHDVKHLIEVLQKLVDHGNTVLIIEHNMDVVKSSDWIIDLGPEGGTGGGKIVAVGTPETIAKKKTPTGIAVKHALFPERKKRIATLKKKKPPSQKDFIQKISIKGACQNNLKDVSIEIPRKMITVCSGPSGSGKSSLAFDTLYAEGQRRYIESLSPYARQFVKQMPKPMVESVEGLSPAITIEQKAHAGNPRSTVGTLTEVYDYLRILFARLGTPHCPETGERIEAISKEHVVDRLLSNPEGSKALILTPITVSNEVEFRTIFTKFQRLGYLRIRLDTKLYEIDPLDSIPYNPKKKQKIFLVIDRLKISSSERDRLLEAVEMGAKLGNDQVVAEVKGKDHYFNLAFSVPSTGKSYPPITPHSFSFNTPEGMCPYCEGLGMHHGTSITSNESLMALSPFDLMEKIWEQTEETMPYDLLTGLLEKAKIDPFSPISSLSPKKSVFLFDGDEKIKVKFGPNTTVSWRGLTPLFSKACQSRKSSVRRAAKLLFDEVECSACEGARIHTLARHVTLNGKAIHNVCSMPIDEMLAWVKTLKPKKEDKEILKEVFTQLKTRLQFLIDVGLSYLAIARSTPTLSGGESQRIRLARQLGSSLTGVLYILDEPSIGLHPSDTDRLIKVLKHLKSLGNTLLVVEHDPATLEAADYLFDFGPKGGDEGGKVLAKGTLSQIKRSSKSLTGMYLSGKKMIPVPKKRRISKEKPLRIKNASLHNLKNIHVEIPLQSFTCLTGVSGAGKSTLLHGLLYPAAKRGIESGEKSIDLKGGKISGLHHFGQVLFIDQNPVGRTIRSDVSTYVDILTPIRQFFAKLPEASVRGLEPKHFSYNHRAGMCTNCFGLGKKRIEMHFMPPITITCESCKGERLNPLSLEVTYQGYNLGQILNLTISKTKELFAHNKRITRILNTLTSVGLEYLKLGQETATLSGGEAQRLKLSRELIKRGSGPALYLMDEPTTGLHPEDIEKLLRVLQALVDEGHTLIVIEHNLDLIKQADHVIELGPKAGSEGGYLIAKGTPEEVAKVKGSPTGKYLKKTLDN